ncbi:hypothetical protein AB0J80_23585 [Actinoplanes sp. NPDC049548]|uniref:hypothetical protein n=1 Tax=Actinoplanes sp. NPDC049548 TaxID=3155152 RepID=UPI003432E1A1
MFATMRRKNRNARMKSELGQSVDHLKRAVSLAAQETSATVGPKFAAAKDRVQPAAGKAKDAASSGWDSAVATLGPLVAAASDTVKDSGKKAAKVNKKAAKANKEAAKASRKSAKKLEKRADKAVSRKKSSKGGKLMKIALAGAAIGAAGAYVMRKRRSDQWDEYDPTPVSTSTPAGAEDAAFEPADLSGPSGFVTPAGSTEPAVGAVGSDPALIPEGDQTSSALHSPEVARMANGKNKS